jgi:hypothetical protein
MKRLSGKLTYANVVATLALFLVLAGGSAFAAKQMLPKNSVGTKQIKNNTITAAKIKNGAVTGAKIAAGAVTGSQIDLDSLGTVPSADSSKTATSAASAGHADNATTAGHADSATTATHADSATTATRADSAATADTATVANAISPPESVRQVGAAGQPAFGPTFGNLPGFADTTVGFYKDREGVVHLQGVTIGNNTKELVFTLPSGYAPLETEFFLAPGNGGTPATVHVEPNGDVITAEKSLVHLNGITWRAGQ